MEIFSVSDLSFTYVQGSTPALSNIDFTVNEGEILLICGPSGCGKSTLLRSLKPQLAPSGERSGCVHFMGKDVYEAPESVTTAQIGFVMQNPDAQIVTDKVWHELAFGLENLGVKTEEIRRRVAEMASFFGIHTWFRKRTSDLSGGQKQLLNLASIMLMDPRALILDEPTAQLDPIATREFMRAVLEINREFGTTIVLTEHNLDECYSIASQVLLMRRDGTAEACLPPREMARHIARDRRGMYCALPAAARIYSETEAGGDYPLTVAQGKRWIEGLCKKTPLALPESIPAPRSDKIALELKEVWFQYKKGGDPVLRGASLDVRRGEFLCLMGGNGSGKTTTLSVLSGNLKPISGKVFVSGEEIFKGKKNAAFPLKLGMLPQNPQSMFVFETLLEDLRETVLPTKTDNVDERIEKLTKRLSLESILHRHPYDLSGGELQRAALAKILLREPDILMLDEPTKGMDAISKDGIGALLSSFAASGVTILMVTHDIEFAAKYAHRCALFFDGYIVSEASAKEFFRGNRFYTTAANRMARRLCADVVTCDEGVFICKQLTNG